MSNNIMKKHLRITLLLTFSLVLQFIERMLPFSLFLPGIKLGLANIVGIIVLYEYGEKDFLKIIILKIFISSLLYGGFGINFLLALSGGLFSCASMIYMKKYTKLSFVGINIVGSNFHIIGQIIMISYLYHTLIFFYFYFPILLIISIITGYIIGILALKLMTQMEM